MAETVVGRIDEARVGDRVYVQREKRPYTVRARGGHFLVCTKPHFRTVLYFIADLKQRIRGPENLVFGFGAETTEQCEEMIERLRGHIVGDCPSEVSYRNQVPLDIVRIVRPGGAPPQEPGNG